jgi:PAS domain S-box-containing protein
MTPGSLYPLDVLVVDDSPSTLDLLSGWLTAGGYAVRAAVSGELALQSAYAYPPALVILDVRMQGVDGFEVCRRLRADARTSEVSVIFISGVTDIADRLRGFEVGGVDFITKPMRREEVLARVHAQMKLHMAMQALNEVNRNLEQTVAQRAAELLRERNTAQNYLDIAGVALFAINCSGDVLMMNRAGESLFGVIESEILGSNFFQTFLPEAERDTAVTQFNALASKKGNTTEHFLLRVTSASGALSTVSCSTKLLTSEDGNCMGTLTSAEDVTEVLKFQQELRDSEERYRGYVENAPVALFITDGFGKCVEANPAACQLLGSVQTDLRGMTIDDLVFADARAAAQSFLAQATQGLNPQGEVSVSSRGGLEVIASVKAVRLSDSRVLWFCTDITDVRRAEVDAVARAVELDEALQRLHSLTAHMHDSIERERLAIATDIHDHVGALLTGAKLLLDHLGSEVSEMSVQHRDMLSQACSVVGQALVSSRGVYAQLRPPMLDDLGLVNTMRWYLADWSKKSGIAEQHYFSNPSTEPGELVRMDVFRIFQELLTNVARHSGASAVKVRLHVGNGGLVLRVRDNGCGFDAKGGVGFGLQGIRGRLNRYSGILSIDKGMPGMVLTARIPSEALISLQKGGAK